MTCRPADPRGPFSVFRLLSGLAVATSLATLACTGNLPGRLPYDDEHGGFIHSGAANNYKNLAEFEKYLAEQFVAFVGKLKKQKISKTGRRPCSTPPSSPGAATWAMRRTTVRSRCASSSLAARAAI